MEEVIKIIKELQVSSGKRLQEILEENRYNRMFRDVIFFVYNPYKTTGLSSKNIKKDVKDVAIKGTEVFAQPDSIYDMFIFLQTHNTGKDEDIAYIQAYIRVQPEEYRDIYEQIFTKELKLGITAKTINKVWKDFIPEFNVMLAEKYWDRMEDLEKTKPNIIITTKLDRHKGGC